MNPVNKAPAGIPQNPKFSPIDTSGGATPPADGYSAGTDAPLFTASSGSELEAMLTANPKFAALLRIMEAAEQQKENAQQLLNSKSGDLDEKTMAIYTQANKAADQLITTATNVQKSNNDMIDTLTRNVG